MPGADRWRLWPRGALTLQTISQIPVVYAEMHAEVRTQGCRMFTVSSYNAQATLFARAYTSHPAEYPLSGLKPIAQDAWYEQVITGRNSFIANTPAEFETLFFDHALIT